jgi:glycosyltransferase involved in cell wall biosynthesis
MKSYFHFDNCLKDYKGHSATFAISMMAANAQLKVLSNQRCVVDSARVLPTFSLCHGDQRISMPNVMSGWHSKLVGVWRLIYANAVYFQDAYRLRAQWNVEETPAVITIANAESRCMFAIVLLALLFPQHRFVFYFQRDKQRVTRLVGLFIRGLRLGNIRCVAETSEMATAWKSVMGLPCATFPFPVSSSAPMTLPRCPTITFAVLGPPRHEKGFDLAFAAYQQIRATEWGDRIKWVFQTAPVWAECQVESTVHSLSTMDDSRLHLLDQPLSHEDYSALWHQVDVVILPYRQAAYSLRSSGVLIEAITNGKPILVTTNTLLHQVGKQYGAIVEIATEDAEGIVLAVQQAILEFNILAEQAIDAARRWQLQFTPTAFLQFIDSECEIF